MIASTLFHFFLHIYTVLDVNVPRPDERSIMTYVSSMYQMLNKHRNKNRNANRVGKVRSGHLLTPISDSFLTVHLLLMTIKM